MAGAVFGSCRRSGRTRLAWTGWSSSSPEPTQRGHRNDLLISSEQLGSFQVACIPSGPLTDTAYTPRGILAHTSLLCFYTFGMCKVLLTIKVPDRTNSKDNG